MTDDFVPIPREVLDHGPVECVCVGGPYHAHVVTWGKTFMVVKADPADTKGCCYFRSVRHGHWLLDYQGDKWRGSGELATTPIAFDRCIVAHKA